MRILIATLAFGLAVAPLTSLAADPMSGGKVFKIEAQNGSNETGTVALKPDGDSTIVEVHLLNAPAGVAQPDHIHMGTCAKLDPAPKYPLQPAMDGTSDTTVKVPIATLMAMPMAVNVHKSSDDLKDYVACADLKP